MGVGISASLPGNGIFRDLLLFRPPSVARMAEAAKLKRPKKVLAPDRRTDRQTDRRTENVRETAAAASAAPADRDNR